METLNNSIELSFENLSLPAQENMGLMGGNYLVETKHNIDFGLGVYGALTGKRGGFFTGGGQIKSQYQIFPNFFTGLELFAGGGGGGSAPQGGGLMFRGAVFTGLNFLKHNIKFGYSYIQFPNGGIDSYQLAIGYAYQFDTLYYPGWHNSQFNRTEINIDDSRLFISDHNFSIQTSFYYPETNNKGVSNKALKQRMDIVGIRYQSHLYDSFWFDFETGGAFGGGIDGFAQIYSGLSYKQPILNRSFFSIGVLLGAAGGGDVNTGGGSMLKAYIGLEYEVFANWYFFTHVGALTAPDGKFRAMTLNLNIGKHYKRLGLMQKKSEYYYRQEPVILNNFRIRPGVQSYIHYSKKSRKNNQVSSANVSSVQLKLDSFITNKAFVTGHAVGAFDGGAGGYAVGLIGVGFQFTRYINSEVLIGAAGGGGIDVGTGKVVQSLLNYEIPLSNIWSIEPGFGYIWAFDGKLSSWVVNVGAVYRFSLPTIN